MKYIDAEKLKAEIERRRLSNRYIDTEDYEAELFDIINFLQQEQPDMDLDFQRFAKEMDTVFALPASQTKNTEEEPLNWEYTIAKHFYELGRNTKESEPQGLDEAAAEQCAAMEYVSTARESESVRDWCTDDVVNAFKAGAEWQKEQIPSTEETELNSLAFLEELGYTCIPPKEQKPSFDIKDAKPGDILHTWSTASSDTFIFKEIDDDGQVRCYCAYDSEDGFREGEYHFIGNKNDRYTLATPKQCYMLFRSMTKAEYSFDFKNNMLVKIKKEQKPVEWSKEDKNKQIPDVIFIQENDQSRTYGVNQNEGISGMHKYIRKDALLEWAKTLKERWEEPPMSNTAKGCIYMLEQVIDKLNSM